MRPVDTEQGTEEYECFGCGKRVTGTENRRCPDCGAEMRHLGRARDL